MSTSEGFTDPMSKASLFLRLLTGVLDVSQNASHERCVSAEHTQTYREEIRSCHLITVLLVLCVPFHLTVVLFDIIYLRKTKLSFIFSQGITALT